MKRLTRAEEEVMQAIWQLEEASAGQVRDVLAKAGNTAKPTTIGTVLRILVEKGFVKTRTLGRAHIYSAAVEKSAYGANRLSSLIERFFGGSPAQLVSFLAEKENLSLAELEALLDQNSQS